MTTRWTMITASACAAPFSPRPKVPRRRNERPSPRRIQAPPSRVRTGKTGPARGGSPGRLEVRADQGGQVGPANRPRSGRGRQRHPDRPSQLGDDHPAVRAAPVQRQGRHSLSRRSTQSLSSLGSSTAMVGAKVLRKPSKIHADSPPNVSCRSRLRPRTATRRPKVPPSQHICP